MGLLDRFKKKEKKAETEPKAEIKTENKTDGTKSPKDYALEFKHAVDVNDINRGNSIVQEWIANYPEDANAHFAFVVVAGSTDISIEELGPLFQKATEYEPMYEEEAEWFGNSAYMAMFMKQLSSKKE